MSEEKSAFDPAHFEGLSPWNDPFVVIDVETTGLVHTKPEGATEGDSAVFDRVVELAAVRFEQRKPTHIITSRINPGRAIPAEATAIHGIGDADVVNAPSFADFFPLVVDLYDSHYVSTVAYNASFDRAFARLEVGLATIDVRPLGLRRPWLDPLVFIRKVDRFVKGTGRHKLTATCERRGIVLERAHAADADAIAAGLLWLQLEREVRSIVGRGVSVTSILRVQGALAEAQERDFQAWLAKQPPRAADVPKAGAA